MRTYKKNIDNFSLEISGKPTEHYNTRLFARNEVEDTPELRDYIMTLHQCRHDLYDKMAALDPANENDLQALITYGQKMEELENQMQKAWGFPVNRNFHSYWYWVPHCTCPKVDNQDRFGTKYRVISGNCPIHNTAAKKT